MNVAWPSTGLEHLSIDPHGRLKAEAAWIRTFLLREELALVGESCAAERRLHHALQDDPLLAVAPQRLQTLADADVADNYRAFLDFRDALLKTGSLEQCYLDQVRSGRVNLAPPFMQALTQAIVHHLVRDTEDALEARAAQMLFRTQRITVQEGVPLAGDEQTLSVLNETGGFGELGKLLAQAQAPIKAAQMKVLQAETAAEWWRTQARGPREHDYLLDLRHEFQQDLGHGLQFTLARSGSALSALARVLERWVHHLLGVRVTITPQSRIDDERWRWHVGLDAESTALLNDLYEAREVTPSRLEQLISLFSLRFADDQDALPEMAGRPVHLGLARTADGLLRCKPQNLLVNLPLRA